MLKFLRDNRTGVFGFVILGFVSITMVGFGINFFAPQGPTQAVIKVDEREISYQEYANKLANNRSLLQQRLGANYEQFASMINFEQQTVDQLIDTAILEKFVDDLDIAPSTALVYQRIASIPYFNGVMTKSSYEAFLRASGMSGPQLESSTRQELSLNMLRTSFSDLSELTQEELKSIFVQSKKKMSFHLASFSPSKFEAKVEIPTEEKLKEYFTENEENYRIPEKVQYQAATFAAAAHVNDVEINKEDVEETYEQIRDDFSIAPTVSFRRIVLKKKDEEPSNPLDDIVGGSDTSASDVSMSKLTHNQKQKAIAEAAIERIDSGEDFAAVAKELSEDEVTKANGGLVEATEYKLLKSSIRNSLYDLESGEVSGVLEDTDAYYIVSPEVKTERQTKTLAEVESQVKDRIRGEYAPEYARIAAETFVADLGDKTDEKSFTELASKKSIPLATTAQALEEGQSSGTIPPAVTNAALSLSEGDIEVVEVENNSYVVLVTEAIASSIPEFATVKDAVLADYKKEKARELASEAANQLLAELQQAVESADELVGKIKKSGAELKTTPLFAAAAPSETLFRQPEILQAAFGLHNGAPVLEQVQQSGTDYVVVAYAKQELPKDSEFDSQRDELLVQEKQVRSNRIFATLQKLLREKAEVWVEPTLLDPGAA